MMKKVLILGSGFAGIQTAIQLQKSDRFSVTLVSNRKYLNEKSFKSIGG